MRALFQIRVQKLFLVAVVLKVSSAVLGWYLNLQWALGFWVPLLVMAAYVAIGLKRQDRDVSDEKFADSCYYLGFIFTVTSIVVSLLDLPYIGDRIQDIAVRFGAAMVSTVFGLVVRVYLVSFRQDASDALKLAEDTVLEAATRFREQLLMAQEKFVDFQGQVTKATEATVESTRLQVEKLSTDHSARLEQLFAALNTRHQSAVEAALGEVRTASERMTLAVDGYIDGMKASLGGLERRVDAFGDAVTARLKTTTFPDDFFASRLQAPVDGLRQATQVVSDQVKAAASGAGEAAAVLAGAIRKLKNKATEAENSLEAVVRLTTAQHALFDTASTQIHELKRLGEVLEAVKGGLDAAAAESKSSGAATNEARARIDALVAWLQTSQKTVTESLNRLNELLDDERAAKASLLNQVAVSGAATQQLAQELRAATSATQDLASRLAKDSGTTADGLGRVVAAVSAQQAATNQVVATLDARSNALHNDMADLVQQLRAVVGQLGAASTAPAVRGSNQSASAPVGLPLTDAGSSASASPAALSAPQFVPGPMGDGARG